MAEAPGGGDVSGDISATNTTITKGQSTTITYAAPSTLSVQSCNIYEDNVLLTQTNTTSGSYVYTPSTVGTHTIKVDFMGEGKAGTTVLRSSSIEITVNPSVIAGGDANVIQGVATLQVNSAIPVGTYEIVGLYSQTDNYQTGSDTGTLVVTKRTPTITVTNSSNSITIGSTLTFNITVTYNNLPITEGVCTFYEDNTAVVFNQTLNNSGQCTLSYTPSTSGTHSYKITYDGTATYNNIVSDTKQVQVNKYQANISSINVKLHTDEFTTITAQVLDSNNNPITTGDVHAKIGGQDITDLQGNVISVTPNEYGIIEIMEDIPDLVESNTYQIQLYYSGTTYYESDVESVTVTAVGVPEITGFTEYNGICGVIEYSSESLNIAMDITSTIPQDVVYGGIECTLILNKSPLLILYTDIYGTTITFSLCSPSAMAQQSFISCDELDYDNGDYLATIDETTMGIQIFRENLTPPSEVIIYLDDNLLTTYSHLEIIPWATDPTEEFYDLSNWGTYPSSASGSSLTTVPTPATTSDMTIDVANKEITVKNNKYCVYAYTMQDFFDYSDEFSVIMKKGNGDGRFELGFVNTTTGGYKVYYSGDPIHLMNTETNFDMNLNSDPNRGAALYNNYNEFTFKLIGTDLHLLYCQNGTTYVDKVIPLGNIDMSKYQFYMRAQVRTDLHLTTNTSKINYHSTQP